MKSYNKKRKPKHQTKPRYKTNEYGDTFFFNINTKKRATMVVSRIDENGIWRSFNSRILKCELFIFLGQVNYKKWRNK